MTTKEAKPYRERLLALGKRLSRDRALLKDEALRADGGEASGGLSNVPLHLGDLGTHASEEEMTLGLIENEEQFIEEINAALERIERGTFGVCEACGRPISGKRLEVLPYARHCVECARKLQRSNAP